MAKLFDGTIATGSLSQNFSVIASQISTASGVAREARTIFSPSPDALDYGKHSLSAISESQTSSDYGTVSDHTEHQDANDKQKQSRQRKRRVRAQPDGVPSPKKKRLTLPKMVALQSLP